MSFASCRRRSFLGAAMLLLAVGMASAQDAKPVEDVTGNGGHLLRYSSKQVEVELTVSQQSAFLHSRDQGYPAVQLDKVLDAVDATLVQEGYTIPDLDRQFHVVEARHDEVLVGKGREILRGVLKSKVPLPARPDHQTTEALVMLVPAPDGHGVLARVRFRITVWDSNGDSRTTVISDPVIYRTFYAGVASRLGGRLPRQ